MYDIIGAGVLLKSNHTQKHSLGLQAQEGRPIHMDRETQTLPSKAIRSEPRNTMESKVYFSYLSSFFESALLKGAQHTLVPSSLCCPMHTTNDCLG